MVAVNAVITGVACKECNTPCAWRMVGLLMLLTVDLNCYAGVVNAFHTLSGI